jgi:hypothetical protein
VAVEAAVIFSDNPCNEKGISKISVSAVQYFQLEDSAKVKIENINLQKDMILKSHCSAGKLQNMVNKSTFQLSEQHIPKMGYFCVSIHCHVY